MQSGKTPTPDDLEKLISKCDALLADVHVWRVNLLELLSLRDEMEELAEYFEGRGVDVTPYRNIMRTIDGVLRNKRTILARQLRKPALVKARADRNPPPQQWWWHMDSLLWEERKRRFLRWLTVGSVVVVLLVGAVLIVNKLTEERSAMSRHLRQAQELYLAGDYHSALSEAQAAAAIIPSETSAYIWQSIIYEKMGEHESESEASFAKAIELSQSEVDSHVERGVSYYGIGDIEASHQDAEAALRLDPESARAYLLTASLYIEEGKLAEAEGAVQNALSYSEGDSVTHVLAKMQLMRLMEAWQVVPWQGSPEVGKDT